MRPFRSQAGFRGNLSILFHRSCRRLQIAAVSQGYARPEKSRKGSNPTCCAKCSFGAACHPNLVGALFQLSCVCRLVSDKHVWPDMFCHGTTNTDQPKNAHVNSRLYTLRPQPLQDVGGYDLLSWLLGVPSRLSLSCCQASRREDLPAVCEREGRNPNTLGNALPEGGGGSSLHPGIITWLHLRRRHVGRDDGGHPRYQASWPVSLSFWSCMYINLTGYIKGLHAASCWVRQRRNAFHTSSTTVARMPADPTVVAREHG